MLRQNFIAKKAGLFLLQTVETLMETKHSFFIAAQLLVTLVARLSLAFFVFMDFNLTKRTFKTAAQFAFDFCYRKNAFVFLLIVAIFELSVIALAIRAVMVYFLPLINACLAEHCTFAACTKYRLLRFWQNYILANETAY